MKKPRLLIPISIQFSVRYILRTGLLDRIREAAEPVLLLGWRDDELERELKQSGIEVSFLITSRIGKRYAAIRSWVDFVQKMRLNTPSEMIWERRADLFRSPYHRFRRRVRRRFCQALFSIPGSLSLLHRKEAELWKSDTNMSEIQDQMELLRPDAALSLTPFFPNEEMALRVCEHQGIPLSVSVLSFDNILTRGWWPVRFEQYLVWNRYNAAELQRGYPDVLPDKVSIVGPAQFDFYWEPAYCWSEEEWRRQLSIPPGRPVVLFGGGHFFFAPQARFLQQIDEAISRNEIPGNPIILFRGHPVEDIKPWLPLLTHAKNVVYDDPSPKGRAIGYADMSSWDIQKLTSCLFHSRVHVSVASTMAVDGAIFDRPQICPAYDDSPDRRFDRACRELYAEEYYLPITRSGGIEVVRSCNELIHALRMGLEDPGRLREQRKKLVREVCTYNDGRSMERVAREVRSFLYQISNGSGNERSGSVPKTDGDQ